MQTKIKVLLVNVFFLVPTLAVAVTICNIIVSVTDIIVMDLHELWHIQISCQTVHLRV